MDPPPIGYLPPLNTRFPLQYPFSLKGSKMKKVLYLLRGVSGSGKSFAAYTLSGCKVFSADDYFISDGKYQFIADQIAQAHIDCHIKCEHAMNIHGCHVAVANTFTREWEMEPYFDLAKKYGYTVISLIVENRHGGKNTHGVPEEKVQEMRDRFEVKL